MEARRSQRHRGASCAATAAASRSVSSGLPTPTSRERYQHCTIANFTAYNESLEKAVDRAQRIADTFPATAKGLFLEGQPGVGKTHLAVAVLRQVIQTSGACGLFYDTRDLLRIIRSTYDASIRTTELEVLRPVMTADLLVLDDLGAEKTSEWVEETMNLIVNTRYNERRLTMFTSNYPDIPDDTDPNSLLFRIGHRMRSRLHEMCEFEMLDGADYRELPVNGGVDDLLTMWKLRKRTQPLPGACRPHRARPASRARPRRAGRPQMARWSSRFLARIQYHGTQHQKSVNGGSTSPLGLYVHIPFCSAICNYCNFNRGLFDNDLKNRYLAALIEEIRAGHDRPRRYHLFWRGHAVAPDRRRNRCGHRRLPIGIRRRRRRRDHASRPIPRRFRSRAWPATGRPVPIASASVSNHSGTMNCAG